MSTIEMIVDLSTVLFAGSDTTATGHPTIIYYLCKDLSKMKKVVDELDAAERQGVLSNPVAYKEALNHLQYLKAVIKDALRIHPGVGLPLERHVPAGGATICGQHILTNTIVGTNAWVLHYDEKVFPQPKKFIPERWLDNDEKKLADMEESFFAFGPGSRTCMGKNASLTEMTKLIPQLLREYEVMLVDPSKEWKTMNVWFVQQSGVECILTKR
jgi:cytochrome P450